MVLVCNEIGIFNVSGNCQVRISINAPCANNTQKQYCQCKYCVIKPPNVTVKPIPTVNETIVKDSAYLTRSGGNSSLSSIKVQDNPLAAPKAVIKRPINNKK